MHNQMKFQKRAENFEDNKGSLVFTIGSNSEQRDDHWVEMGSNYTASLLNYVSVTVELQNST
jgi:hypothetical protein